MGSIRHGYFVLQIKASRIAGEVWFSGVVENLASGQKTRFQTADGLLAIVRAWGTADDVADPTQPIAGNP